MTTPTRCFYYLCSFIVLGLTVLEYIWSAILITSFPSSITTTTTVPSAPGSTNDSNYNNNNYDDLPHDYYNIHGGPATQYSLKHGFRNRMQFIPQEQWPILDKYNNLKDCSNVDNDKNNNIPNAILIGTQKGGTTALFEYLMGHPQIDIASAVSKKGKNKNKQRSKLMKSKELYFFDSEMDQIMMLLQQESSKQNDNNNTMTNDYNIINVTQVQKQLVQHVQRHQHIQDIQNRYIIDFTPNYLFESDRVPSRIACISPNAKILAVLRDPVDRAYSNYQMKKKPGNKLTKQYPTFEEYIEMDFAVLQETGVILPMENKEEYMTVKQSENDKQKEQQQQQQQQQQNSIIHPQAWVRYTRSGVNAPIGFGLYAIQIQQYIQAFERHGKPLSDLLILQSNDLKYNVKETFAKVLQFLGLEPYELDHYPLGNKREYEPMNNATRERLVRFFEPYNRQLEELLGEEFKGFGQPTTFQ